MPVARLAGASLAHVVEAPDAAPNLDPGFHPWVALLCHYQRARDGKDDAGFG
jgi:hypothetical protein